MRPEGLSMRNSNDTIGNRTRNLPACIVVPQPTSSSSSSSSGGGSGSVLVSVTINLPQTVL